MLLREDAISQEVLEPIFGPMREAVKKRRIRKSKTKVRGGGPVAGPCFCLLWAVSRDFSLQQLEHRSRAVLCHAVPCYAVLPC